LNVQGATGSKSKKQFEDLSIDEFLAGDYGDSAREEPSEDMKQLFRSSQS